MISFFRNTNTTVKEMWLGIGLWGIVCELATIWFTKDKAACSLGILIGVLLAMAGVWHMWKVLDTALELGEGAQKYQTVRSVVRYLVYVIVFAVMMLTDFANPLTAFLALMGMKVSAYLQPAIHKIIERRR